MITIGTKAKNSAILAGKRQYFKRTNGKTRDSQVAKPQTMIVNIVLENMFQPHPQSTAPDGYANNN